MIPTLIDISQLVLAGSIWQARLWYSLPLIVVVSLVYGATRHERIREIIEHSIRSVIWLSGFMLAILVAIWLAGFWN